MSIFNELDYGKAPESVTEVNTWLDNHGRHFGHYIAGEWVAAQALFATHNPATGDEIAQVAQGTTDDVDAAVKAARKAQKSWAELGGKGRARYLYALARHLQKHARRFAVLESLDNGKPIRESRDGDIPLAIRHFYHHAGWAQQFDREFTGFAAHGVVGQIIPWNFPLLMLAWKIAPALAAGNTVVLKPAEYTPLTALAFAEICTEIGLPKGVVNIVTGAGETGAALVAHKDINKIAFTGSTAVGRHIQEELAGRDVALTLELGGKSPFIVFEDADLDAAVEGIVDSIFFNQGEVCCAGSRLLVQEQVAETLYAKLRARMAKLRLGDPMDKSTDVGALADPVQHARVTELVNTGLKSGGTAFVAPCSLPGSLPDVGCFYPPTLITDIHPAHPLFDDEIFGPVLVATTFRTEAEAVSLANNTRYGLASSIWSENIDQVMAVAPQIRAGVVWINTANQFDASAEFGGVGESGFGREGGKSGMHAYLKPVTAKPKPPALATKIGAQGEVDVTRKFFIGGKQTRPDSGHSYAVTAADGTVIDHIGVGNRKDIRNAVEAAANHKTWRGASGHNRAQVLYYMAENLSRRADEFTTTLSHALKPNDARTEVEEAIDHLFSFAAMADKFDGRVHSVPVRALALAVNEPAGVIGVTHRGPSPFSGPVRAMAACLAAGAPQVIIAPEAFPLAVLDLASLCETSDIPAGAVNIVAGPMDDLGREMAKHHGVDVLWQMGGRDAGAEKLAATNIKRVFSGAPKLFDETYLMAQASEVKTIWLPYGALAGGGVIY